MIPTNGKESVVKKKSSNETDKYCYADNISRW